MRDISIFYMCEPGNLEWQSLCLASSLLTLCVDSYDLVAYCSRSKLRYLRQETLSFHKKHGIPIVPIDTDGVFAGTYHVGNKVIAASQARDCDFSLLLDTDTVLVNNTSFYSLLRNRGVSAFFSVASALGYTKETWEYVYSKVGLALPPRRLRIDYSSVRWEFGFPYFNAGVIAFPRGEFGQIWLDVTKVIQLDPMIPARSPWLDQISLPVAIEKSDLAPNPIDRKYNFAVEEPGREIRSEVCVIHYHFGENLQQCSRAAIVNDMLREMTEFASLEDLFSKYEFIGYRKKVALTDRPDR